MYEVHVKNLKNFVDISGMSSEGITTEKANVVMLNISSPEKMSIMTRICNAIFASEGMKDLVRMVTVLMKPGAYNHTF